MDIRKTGKIFGWLFIATFVTSIPARLLFVTGSGRSWQDMRFIPGALSENSMYLGAILEFGVILANIATAIVLYPIVRRRFEAGAIGYVAARITESAFILVGLVSIISVVSVSQQLARRAAPPRPRSRRRAVRWCPRTSGRSCSARASSSDSATVCSSGT